MINNCVVHKEKKLEEVQILLLQLEEKEKIHKEVDFDEILKGKPCIRE